MKNNYSDGDVAFIKWLSEHNLKVDEIKQKEIERIVESKKTTTTPPPEPHEPPADPNDPPEPQ